MTADQRRRFNEYGCVSRCIIKLAKTKGNSITDDEFCAKFDRRLFLNWERYGMLLTSQIVEVIKDLRLGRHFLTFRRYPAIVSRFREGQTDILVFSEIDLRENENGCVDHCSLLREIDDQHFKLWIPWKDGSNSERNLEARLWDDKACQGLILQR